MSLADLGLILQIKDRERWVKKVISQAPQECKFITIIADECTPEEKKQILKNTTKEMTWSFKGEFPFLVAVTFKSDRPFNTLMVAYWRINPKNAEIIYS